MFHKIPNIISKTELVYEINDDWIIVSVSTKGLRTILKSGEDGRVKLAGKRYKIYDIAKRAGIDPKSWPEDDRDWEELKTTIDRYRYRTFLDSQVQKMDQYGNVSYQEHTKQSNGYYTVAIAGKSIKVHQMMGETHFVPKPDNMPSDWTVHHIDNDPSNNHCDNLTWASPKKQIEERRSMDQHSIRSCPVIGTALHDVILKDGTMIRKGEDTHIFDNMNKAAEAIIGGNRANISSCINGRLTSHAKFTWKTAPSDEDFNGELFKIIGMNDQSDRFISIYSRMKQVFKNGYTKIMFAKDLLTKREQRETDSYPRIKINEKHVYFHRLVVELFFGKLPKMITINGRTHNLIVDHIDDDKQNARLDNLQLLTQQENNMKHHLDRYTTSVASAVWNERKSIHEYECSHKTRINAIEYVKSQGYLNATLEELNIYVNTPNEIYGRMWIRAHFETIM